MVNDSLKGSYSRSPTRMEVTHVWLDCPNFYPTGTAEALFHPSINLSGQDFSSEAINRHKFGTGIGKRLGIGHSNGGWCRGPIPHGHCWFNFQEMTCVYEKSQRMNLSLWALWSRYRGFCKAPPQNTVPKIQRGYHTFMILWTNSILNALGAYDRAFGPKSTNREITASTCTLSREWANFLRE